MGWFLYNKDLRHERVKKNEAKLLINSKRRKNGSEKPLLSTLTRFGYMTHIPKFPF